MNSPDFSDDSHDPELPYQSELKQMSDKEYLDLVTEFLKPTKIEYLFVFIFLLLMVVGIIGNCLVVYVVLRNKNMVKIFWWKWKIRFVGIKNTVLRSKL